MAVRMQHREEEWKLLWIWGGRSLKMANTEDEEDEEEEGKGETLAAISLGFTSRPCLTLCLLTMYVCMYICMYVYVSDARVMYVCMYVCMYVYVWDAPEGWRGNRSHEWCMACTRGRVRSALSDLDKKGTPVKKLTPFVTKHPIRPVSIETPCSLEYVKIILGVGKQVPPDGS